MHQGKTAGAIVGSILAGIVAILVVAFLGKILWNTIGITDPISYLQAFSATLLLYFAGLIFNANLSNRQG